MASSKFEHSVDEILKTVQQRQAAQSPSSDDAVNDILAGLGMGDELLGLVKKPAAPAKPAAKGADAPARRPAAKPAERAAVSAEKPAAPARSAEKAAAKPPERLAPKAAEKPAPKPAGEPAQAGGQPARGPAQAPKPAEKPAQKPAAKPVPKPELEPAGQPAQGHAPGPAERPAQAPKAAEKPIQKPAERAQQEAAPAERPGPKPAAAPAERPGPKPAAKPAAPQTPADEENEPPREFPPPAAKEIARSGRAAAASGGPAIGAARDSAGPGPAGGEGARPARDAGPAVRPLESASGVLHLNELVDEEFTKFFSETVAVVPEEELEPEPGGFFQRRRSRKARAARAAAEEEPLRPDEGLTGEVQLEPEGPLLADLDQEPPGYGEEPPARRRFVLPRIFGVEEPEEEGPFEEEEPEDYLDDYADLQDAPSVQADLRGMRASLQLRAVLTGLLTALLFYLGLAASGFLPVPAALDPSIAPAAYLGASLALLAAAGALSFQALRSGLAGLFGAPSPDSLPALAFLAAAAQLLVFLFKPDSYLPVETTLFAAAAALLLCLDAVGKRMMSGVVERNFEIVSSGVDHVAAYRLRDKKLAETAAAGLAEPEPSLLINRPTALVKGFLHQSFSERWSDRLAQRLAWAMAGCALAAAVIAAAKGGGAAGAVSVLAGALCLGGPLSCTLLSAVPSLLMQKSACRVGAVVPGWSAVQEMSRANVVVVGARDLFPSASVVLHGIKTFEKERIDLAILYAASVLIEGCDTLRDVFLSIIQNKTEMLYPVENLTHEVGGGFVAWVEHNRVILGSREMMQSHDIDIPSMDCENRYTRSGRYQPIYLAVSGKLFGMFVVSYRPDPDVADVLGQLLRSGLSVLVKSDDFSITAPLIQRVYRLREGSVKVLSGPERKALAPATAYLPESEGCMTHLGSFASFVGGLQAAEGAASGERAAALVQAVSVVCSCVLALLLAFTGGLSGLALPALILYQAAWSALALAMPLLKKY